MNENDTSQPLSLYVRVVQAKKLKAVDSNGLSDPYCILQVGKVKQRTKTKKKNLNPKWNELFKFENVLVQKDVLRLSAMDWNRVGSKLVGDSPLGSTEIPLNTLALDKTKEEWVKLVGENGQEEQGEVHLLLHITSEESGVSKRPILQPSVSEGHGQLLVEVISARDLLAKDRRTGSSDPFCEVSLGDETYKTEIVSRDLNPVWNEEFYFEVENESQELNVAIWDWNLIGSSEFLGMVAVPLKEVLDGISREQNYKLQPRPGKKDETKGEIRLRIHYVSALQAQKHYIVAQQRYDDIMRILTAPDMVIVATLCRVYESSEVTKTITNLFSYEEKILILLNQLVYRDLKALKQEGTIFRTDSPATKVMTVFLKTSAASYLQDVLGEMVREVVKDPNGYEIDPNKYKGSLSANMDQLRNTCQKFFDTIVNSYDKMPANSKLALHNMRRLVANCAFPKSELLAVGAFVFLRFIGPSLMAPEGFGLVKAPPDQEGRRALSLIAKVLQNTANQAYFKEEYMFELNSFIDQNKNRTLQFYDKLSTPTEAKTNEEVTFEDEEKEKEEKIKELAIIIKHLANNIGKVEANYAQDPRVSNPAKLEANKKLIEELKQILREFSLKA